MSVSCMLLSNWRTGINIRHALQPIGSKPPCLIYWQTSVTRATPSHFLSPSPSQWLRHRRSAGGHKKPTDVYPPRTLVTSDGRKNSPRGRWPNAPVAQMEVESTSTIFPHLHQEMDEKSIQVCVGQRRETAGKNTFWMRYDLTPMTWRMTQDTPSRPSCYWGSNASFCTFLALSTVCSMLSSLPWQPQPLLYTHRPIVFWDWLKKKKARGYMNCVELLKKVSVLLEEEVKFMQDALERQVD